MHRYNILALVVNSDTALVKVVMYRTLECACRCCLLSRNVSSLVSSYWTNHSRPGRLSRPMQHLLETENVPRMRGAIAGQVRGMNLRNLKSLERSRQHGNL